MSEDLADAEAPRTADSPPPRSPLDELIPGQLPAADLDPLADGILMAHQKAWIEDQSPLKLAEKGRRCGITFAEALDSTLIAAAARSAGGDDTWYIGDTKEKGLEFVATAARFARHVAGELLTVGEFVFDDQRPDGSSRQITAYRIRFASGHRITALASRPVTIRGLQGRVVIDEAAFHADVAGVIDAANALLIWGGVIRVISTHNGALNPFAELVRESREGKWDYRIHRITFDDAVANGLYERVCLIKGTVPTAEGKAEWYRRVRRSYGTRVEAMREELDAIPREGEGQLLPLAWIEAAAQEDCRVCRWSPPEEGFVDWPEPLRRLEMRGWLEREVAPVLRRFHNQPLVWSIGGDFALRQDRSSFACGFVGETLHRHVPLIVELRACPYDQQKQVLFWLFAVLRVGMTVLDANGNGMVLAQEARQKVGQARCLELMANDAWYREHTPKFRSAFEDRTIHIPADKDTRDDLRQLAVINGVGKVPRNIRTEGTDGGRRHADNAVALLNFYAATLAAAPPFEFASTGDRRVGIGAWGDAPATGSSRTGFGTVPGGLDLSGW